MGKIHVQLTQFKNALDRMAELTNPATMIERDALIQRFEFTFDIGWKTLKSYLFNEHSIEAQTPLQAFQEAVRIGLLSSTSPWLELRDARNATSHIYSEKLAATVSLHAESYYTTLLSLYTALTAK
jgi:nucleotidyltransferase substrate binding protein (TIGR01987 family)